MNTQFGPIEKPNTVANQRDKLRVSTRQWLIERWAPGEFTPPAKLELTGKDGGPLLLEQLTLLAVKQVEQEPRGDVITGEAQPVITGKS
jgi:hypothetical protein